MKKLVFVILALFVATMATAQDGYRVKSGDILSIEVLEDPQLNRETLVTPAGSFSFPFAGTVNAAGRTTDQIASDLIASLSPNFAVSPNVFVSVRALAPEQPRAPSSGSGSQIDVYILGEVNTPGIAQFDRGTTLLQALAATGGFTRFAATKRIQLRRTNPSTGETGAAIINFRALEKGGAYEDITLADGDVILVPERRLFE